MSDCRKRFQPDRLEINCSDLEKELKPSQITEFKKSGNLHITPYESSVNVPLSFFRIDVCPVHRIGHFLFHQEGTAVSA